MISSSPSGVGFLFGIIKVYKDGCLRSQLQNPVGDFNVRVKKFKLLRNAFQIPTFEARDLYKMTKTRREKRVGGSSKSLISVV